MRFNLLLHTDDPAPTLPINYQYPLSAAVYKIIQNADATHAEFLHEHGYSLRDSLKNFKLFTFSDIHVPFQIRKDRLILKSSTARVTIAFQLPHTAETFIKGLFLSHQLEIGDKYSSVRFQIQQVESEASFPLSVKLKEGNIEILLHPLSPIVSGKKNVRGHYDFLSPENPEFTDWLLHNWKEKYRTVYPQENIEEIFKHTEINILPGNKPARSRLITIKAYTKEETKIRGFDRFKMKVLAPEKALVLLLNAGCGIYNALGMGCLELSS